jgi:predicted peptidase
MGTVADRITGWLPGGMTHPVTAATIEGVTAIKEGGKLTAVAVKYSVDMENAVINMKGDAVLDSKGQPRENDFVVMDTFDFYDENNAKISGIITNIYINDSPEVMPDAVRGSGEGNYVIVEIETDSSATSVGVIQRTTVRTNEAIASASSKLWEETPTNPSAVSADDAITGITTTGLVDVDGAKVAVISVEYNLELEGAAIDKNTFEIWDYALGKAIEVGSNPGQVKNVYIDNEPYDTDGKTGSGNYAVIELNTEYQLGSVPKYKVAMAAGVKQIGEFTTTDGTNVTAGTTQFKNYTVVEGKDKNGNPTYTNTAIPGKFFITNITDFKLFTNDSPEVLGYTPDGAAFQATICFEELDGELYDVDLPYALYVPADYDPSKKYMLALHVVDAGALGTDPMITLTEARANVNYASPEVQQMAKDQGFGGLIVVAPQVPSALRSTRDNYSMSAAVPATWQLLDYITDAYNIDMDHIYASGQSMGGMQVVSMAAQRDNYFAAVWPIGSQWGSNNNLEVPYQNAPYYESTDATIWTEDAHGNPVDYRNWYYLISDDNILIDNCAGDPFSSTVWKECTTLYKDITGGAVDIKGSRYTKFSPFAGLEDQNTAVSALKAITDANTVNEPGFGMIWEAYEGGSHMVTWVYAHRIFANYEWLLSQTRQTEMARTKLDLDKPFVAAAVQLTDADHLIFDGKDYYFVTAEEGCGTAGYNTGFYNPQGSVVRNPGWAVGIIGPDTLSVESTTSAGIKLVFNTASSNAVDAYYSMTVNNVPYVTTGGALTFTYQRGDGSWGDISEILDLASATPLTDGQILTLSVDGIVEDTYTVVFTAKIGAMTLIKRIEVTVAAPAAPSP